MSKQLTSQKFILKLHSSRLRMARWNLKVNLSEAAVNEELIKLSDSQIMRFIQDINGVDSNQVDETVKSLRKQLKYLKKQEQSVEVVLA